MSSVSKHRKIKRPTVLIKRTQCPRNRPSKVRTPSYDKLKSNNHSLARALSQEKQESQSLFSQNVALVAEVHDLGFACKRRDDIILNILKNAKEMLKMMVTMTNCLTNTISSCQEFASNPGNSFRSSASSSGRRDSTRRLSTKSPARGVVKPMVSGHTITKPTINLSRVNMQNIQNALSLATIDEAPSSPDRSSGSPSSVSSSSPTRVSEASTRRQLNYENRRVCRMSERIPVAVMNSDGNENRLSNNRTRISDRFSGKFSKRKSASSSENRVKKCSTGRQSNKIEIAQIRSPRVALSDVSKFLQNSQTVNVRVLEENSMNIDEAQGVNITLRSQTSQNRTLNSENEVRFQLSDSDSDSEICKKIPSRPVSNRHNSEVKKRRSSILNRSNILNKSSVFEKLDIDKSADINGSMNYKQCNDSKKQKLSTSPTNDDPLEGSSWMYNDTQNRTFPNTNESNLSDSKNRITVRFKESVTSTLQNEMTFTPVTNLAKSSDETQSEESETPKKNEYLKSAANENSPKVEMTMNFAQFVTKHRGHSSVKDVEDFDELDDPTIMLNIRQQTESSKFNIDDLRLPVVNNSVVTRTETEPEVTSTINIVEINGVVKDPVNYLPNLSMPRISDFRIAEDDTHQRSTPVVEKVKVPKKRKKKNMSVVIVDQENQRSPRNTAKKKVTKHKTNMGDKDPSAAKVVLQKLPSQDKKISDESVRLSRNSTIIQPEPSSDSESSNASSRIFSSRPRRQKAPVNLQEPSLSKKLRRQD